MTSVGKYEVKVKEISTNFAPLNQCFMCITVLTLKITYPNACFFLN